MATGTEAPRRMTAEEESKDEFFRRIADLADEMIAAHGRDFATGALVLAARWVAEGRGGDETRKKTLS